MLSMTELASVTMSKSAPIYTSILPQESASTPSKAALPSPLSNPGPVSRNMNGVGATSEHRYVPSPGPFPPPRSAGYSYQSYNLPVVPNVHLPSYHDIAHPRGAYSNGQEQISNPQMTVIPQGHKRAYRQRRKEPSCDACRERKVKCDATDSASCTECISRTVRCQFTKDTNRRMTSMKHNQDLIKELARTRSELDQYKCLAEGRSVQLSPLSTGPSSELHRHPIDMSDARSRSASCLSRPADGPQAYERISVSPNSSLPPTTDLPPEKKRRITISPDSSRIELNLNRYGRGIFKTLHLHTRTIKPAAIPVPALELPPKHVADDLLHRYNYNLHSFFPVFHWPSFQKQYDAMYSQQSLSNLPRIWVGLMFSVFALGCPIEDSEEALRYLGISLSQIDISDENFDLDHPRVALLISICLTETNRKTAGSTWLGIASRIAYDMNLHQAPKTLSPWKTEMRRRVWWCIYAWDSLFSLETGCPAMIKEEDYAANLPSTLDDRLIYPTMSWDHLLPRQLESPLDQMIKVIDCTPRLSQAHKASCPPHIIHTNDIDLRKCYEALSQDQLQEGKVDTIRMRLFLYLQNARLILHRHNLTPASDFLARQEAINRCASIGRGTAQCLQRWMREGTTQSENHAAASEKACIQEMLSPVSAFHCTHVWRCTLFLLLKLDFANALICARASLIWGRRREVNMACGRYLEFFVGELVSKLDQGQTLETDGELVAYVIGDHRCNIDRLWVWKHSKPDENLASPSDSPNLSYEATGETKDEEMGQLANEESWDGWERIITMMERLQRGRQEEQEARTKPPLLTSPRPNDQRATTTSPGGVTSNRLSIKDLI